jgi:hypothetical protein
VKERFTSSPKITAQEAIEIATQKFRNHDLRWIEVYADLPENIQIYPRDQAKDCWSVMMSEGRSNNFQNSRLLCISRASGKIVYDGLAVSVPASTCLTDESAT